MIEIKNLSYQIGNTASPLLSLKILPNTLNLIVGNNGEGKTLFLKTIIGDNPIHHGEVINHQQVRYCGVQSYAAWNLSVEDYFSYLKITNKVDKDQLYFLCEYFELLPHLKTKITLLSAGEKRRLSIVETELMMADIILYDEPEINLDLGLRKKWLMYLENNLSKKAYVIVSHYPEIYKKMAHQLIRVNKEKIDVISEKSKMEIEFLYDNN